MAGKKKEMQRKKMQAQAILEFVFSFVIVALIFFSCVRSMQWVGFALVRPGLEQDEVKSNPAPDNADTWGWAWNALERPSGELPDLKLVFNGELIKAP